MRGGKRPWSEEDMQQAIAEVAGGAGSCRSIAKKHKMHESILRWRVKKHGLGVPLRRPGRKPALDENQEKELARCVSVLCGIGFSPMKENIKDLVRDYVQKYEIPNPFSDDRPGDSWFELFMRRNRLSLKKANMTSPTPRKSPRNTRGLGELRPPPGKKWIRAWVLVDEEASSSRTRDKSFEEVLLNKIKGPTEKQTQKRRKIDLKTKVTTEKEYADAIRGRERKNKTESGRRKIDFTIQPSESDSDGKEDDSEDSEKESSSDALPVSVEERMKRTWESVSPPTAEADVLNRWYGAIYANGKKTTFYVGRATRRFLVDENGPVQALELDCLKPHVGQGNVLESAPTHLPPDVDIFPICNVISGPLDVAKSKGNKWIVSNYEELRKLYCQVLKVERDKVAESFMSSKSRTTQEACHVANRFVTS